MTSTTTPAEITYAVAGHAPMQVESLIVDTARRLAGEHYSPAHRQQVADQLGAMTRRLATFHADSINSKAELRKFNQGVARWIETI